MSTSPDSAPLAVPPELAPRLRTARRAVLFSGAGISRESGLATFRGDGGLWQRYRPEELATPQAFQRQPGVVWQWYGERYRRAAATSPNAAHQAAARLEEHFPSLTVVTQNVDGLHQRAGSRRVLELHGTLIRARCNHCGEGCDMDQALEKSADTPPVCRCGGPFRPAVVWFGEALPREVFEAAAAACREADLFLAVGTSGQVFPAAGLIEVAHRAGALVVEINPEPSAFSSLAHWHLAAPAGQALPALVEAVARCRRSS